MSCNLTWSVDKGPGIGLDHFLVGLVGWAQWLNGVVLKNQHLFGEEPSRTRKVTCRNRSIFNLRPWSNRTHGNGTFRWSEKHWNSHTRLLWLDRWERRISFQNLVLMCFTEPQSRVSLGPPAPNANLEKNLFHLKILQWMLEGSVTISYTVRLSFMIII